MWVMSCLTPFLQEPTMEIKQIHRILEGALFAAGEPLTIDRILNLFEKKQRPEKQVIKEALAELTSHYEEHGIELKNLASGYQFQVRADLASWIKRLWEEKPPRYSRALMETLALVAYRQPITRSEIEEVRGVLVSTNIMRTLMEHGWVRIVGHRDVPGRPGLYATTKQFLDNFGMKNLSELPPLSEIQDLNQMEKGLEQVLLQQEDAPENSDESEEIMVGDEQIVMPENIEDSEEDIVEEDEQAVTSENVEDSQSEIAEKEHV